MQYPGKNCIIRAQITIGQEKQTLLLKQIFLIRFRDHGTAGILCTLSDGHK